GYERALSEAGLLHQRLIALVDGEGPSDFQRGSELCEQVLSTENPPSAILAYNDVTAIGALRAAHRRGRMVPDDLSVVGFDDIEAGRYGVPELTTVALPTREAAQRAVQILLDLLSGIPSENGSDSSLIYE